MMKILKIQCAMRAKGPLRSMMVLTLFFTACHLYANSVYMVRPYYEQPDKSLEAAKPLRPLAVVDNAEAQAMSASSEDEPELIGDAPSQVATGEQFRLTYRVNTHDASGFRGGDMPDVFDVLAGPLSSTQSSFQMVNGKTTATQTITYTYILTASKQGSFTIPAAHVTAKGKEIQSNTLTITVSGTYEKKDTSDRKAVATSNDITDSDLFITASTDKNNVRLGDSLTLTQKLYTLVDVTSVNGVGSPDIDACYFKDEPLPREKSFVIEQYNGKNYKAVVWQKYTIVPLKTGTIVIRPQKFDCLVSVRDTSADPFEAFFNGGTNNVEIKKSVYSPQLSFTVYE